MLEKKEQKKNLKVLRRSQHARALAASELSDYENPEASNDTHSDEKDKVKNYHYSIEKSRACKIPESDWCSDSWCTTHMTGDPALCRGPMIKIERQKVKVSSGNLDAEYVGQVVMRVSGASLLLENVLFVPGLGVN